jgi:hypothetical protein
LYSVRSVVGEYNRDNAAERKKYDSPVIALSRKRSGENAAPGDVTAFFLTPSQKKKTHKTATTQKTLTEKTTNEILLFSDVALYRKNDTRNVVIFMNNFLKRKKKQVVVFVWMNKHETNISRNTHL